MYSKIISIAIFIVLAIIGYGLFVANAEPEFRMGWPVGTTWNIKGATGDDRKKCNDICKSLGYNYYTHNPPPADGGCGCYRSFVGMKELTMTDHDNAKTRRVV